MNNWDKVPKYLQEKIDEHIFKIEPKEKIMKNRTLSEKERELINYVFETYVQPMDKNNDGEQCNNYSWVDAKDMVFDIEEKLKPKNFEEAVRPLMQYLGKNHHPHISVIATNNSAEMLEGIESVVTNEYIVD